MMHSEPHTPSRSDARLKALLSPRLSTICEAAKNPPIAPTVAMNLRLTRWTRAATKVAATRTDAAHRYAAVPNQATRKMTTAAANAYPIPIAHHVRGASARFNTPPLPVFNVGKRVSTPRPKRLVRLHETAKMHKGWFSPREQ